MNVCIAGALSTVVLASAATLLGALRQERSAGKSVSTENARPTRDDAVAVVQRFINMDVDGERLTPEGWRKANELFMNAADTPKQNRITIIAVHYAVSEWSSPGDTSYTFGYEELGELDSALRWHPSENKREVRIFRGYHVQKLGTEWKIEGVQPAEVHLVPDAAVRYLSLMSDRSQSSQLKRNAATSLAILRHYARPAQQLHGGCAC